MRYVQRLVGLVCHRIMRPRMWPLVKRPDVKWTFYDVCWIWFYNRDQATLDAIMPKITPIAAYNRISWSSSIKLLFGSAGSRKCLTICRYRAKRFDLKGIPYSKEALLLSGIYCILCLCQQYLEIDAGLPVEAFYTFSAMSVLQVWPRNRVGC